LLHPHRTSMKEKPSLEKQISDLRYLVAESTKILLLLQVQVRYHDT
jgi:hypothetical protein